MNQYSSFYDVTGPSPSDANVKQMYDHLKKGLVGSILNVHGVKEVREVQKLAVETSRLGIPLICGYDVIHGHKTLTPVPLAEAASWVLEVIRQSAEGIAAEATAIVRPVKELKGFKKIHLKAHESKTVIFQLTPEELGFYDPDGYFLVESGTFVVMAGTNSVQILSKSFELK